jgi:excisionase family DNA binding protein
MEKLLLTVREAADCAGIGRTKMYEIINAGELPVVRIGRAVRIPAHILRQWVLEKSEYGLPGKDL